MVLVDSTNKILSTGMVITISGAPHRISSIITPSKTEGYLTVIDLTSGQEKKVYPTLFHGRWDSSKEYKKTNFVSKQNN